MREFLMRIFGPLPLTPLKNLARVNPLIINYHVVEDKKLPHIANLYSYKSISRFKDDLDFLVKHFKPIGLAEFLNHIHGKAALPDNSFLLTFDDGFREIYDIVAPILVQKNLTATFFLTSNFIDNQNLGYDQKKSLLIDHLINSENRESIQYVNSLFGLDSNNESDLKKALLAVPYNNRALIDKIGLEIKCDFNKYLTNNKPYLTNDQIKDLLKMGFTIGAHSIDHPRFSELELKAQLHQAISSIQQVADQFSLPYKVFAFPYSDNKISIDFFEALSSHTEATFGTQGVIQDQVVNNFQRVSVEKFSLSANRVIKFHLVRKILYRKLGKDCIVRCNYK